VVRVIDNSVEYFWEGAIDDSDVAEDRSSAGF
jgi:hypothetical protein